MVVTNAALKKAVSVLGLAGPLPGVPSSVFVGMEFDFATARLRCKLSAAVSVIADIAVDGAPTLPLTAVDRRTLFPFVGALSDAGNATLKMNGGTLEITSGTQRAAIQTVTPNWAYGDIDVSQFQAYTMPQALIDTIACARICASEDPASPEVNCVCIDFGKNGAYVYATNDLILACAKTDTVPDAIGQTWALPNALVDALVGSNEILIHEHIVCGKVDGGLIWGSAPEKAWTDFPKSKIQTLVVQARKSKPLFSAATSTVIETCQRFTAYIGALPKSEWVLNLTAATGKVRAETTSQYAHFTEVFAAQTSGQGATQVNLAVFTPLIPKLPTDGQTVVSIVGNGAVCRIGVGGFEFLLSQRG